MAHFLAVPDVRETGHPDVAESLLRGAPLLVQSVEEGENLIVEVVHGYVPIRNDAAAGELAIAAVRSGAPWNREGLFDAEGRPVPGWAAVGLAAIPPTHTLQLADAGQLIELTSFTVNGVPYEAAADF